MPNLLPFRARYSPADTIYIPGLESPKLLDPARLSEVQQPALYLYRQAFGESTRYGVAGLLDRDEATIYPHEETMPEHLAACAQSIAAGGTDHAQTDHGSLWLWCHDDEATLTPLLIPAASPAHEGTDMLGVHHQFWPVADPVAIRQLQNALEGRELFLADGHHRFAAGWNLATVQIRNETLRSRPSHRLILDARELMLPDLYPISDINTFWRETPPGCARFGVFIQGQPLRGIEIPCHASQNKLSALRQNVIREARSEAIRDFKQAGEGQLVLLVEPPDIDAIERDARLGVLLPPRSTDFYPKLAAGLIVQV